MQSAAEQIAEIGDAAADPAQVVVNVAEVLPKVIGSHFEMAPDDLIDRPREGANRGVEVEYLSLQLVDPLGGVVAFLGEDLALYLLDIDVYALGRFFVAVDHMVEDRVEGHAGAMAEQIGTALDPLSDSPETTLAVADGDDEPRVDEDHQLADLDHLFGIDVMGGLNHNEEGVAVELHLGALVGLDRILDRKLVEIELAGDLLELLRRGLEHTEPDKCPIATSSCAGIIESEVAVEAATILIGGTVDDHRSSIAPSLAVKDAFSQMLRQKLSRADLRLLAHPRVRRSPGSADRLPCSERDREKNSTWPRRRRCSPSAAALRRPT